MATGNFYFNRIFYSSEQETQFAQLNQEFMNVMLSSDADPAMATSNYKLKWLRCFPTRLGLQLQFTC